MRLGRRLKIDEAEDLIAQILVKSAVSEVNARLVAKALVAAEVDGQAGHGFSRVAAYAAQARSGKVSGYATPRVAASKGALIEIDAGSGFAFPAIDLAIAELVQHAPNFGMCGAAIRGSHHCGQLGAHVERLAQEGLVSLMFANTPKAMAPWGGKDPVFGTNPIAFGAPQLDADPIVIDLSLSKVARGKVMAAKKKGEAIPEGWALDADGNPTTDPDAALQGTMVPTGDAKGAALALIVEVLAATLTGANYSSEAMSFFDSDGAPPGVGQFIIAIDPGAVKGARFGSRLKELVAQIDSQDGARLPGSRRLEARKDAQENGVSVPEHLLEELQQIVNA